MSSCRSLITASILGGLTVLILMMIFVPFPLKMEAKGEAIPKGREQIYAPMGGTVDLVRELGQRRSHICCVQRLGRRGLSSACIEGILASSAPFIAVMDADMQHDEALLPDMLAMI